MADQKTAAEKAAEAEQKRIADAKEKADAAAQRATDANARQDEQQAKKAPSEDHDGDYIVVRPADSKAEGHSPKYLMQTPGYLGWIADPREALKFKSKADAKEHADRVGEGSIVAPYKV